MVPRNSQLEVAPVAHGDVATIEPTDLPRGSVFTSSGRISRVTEPGELSVHYPFPIDDLVAVDDALKYASRASNARFAVYLGDLGSDTAARARDLGQGADTQRRGAGCGLTRPMRRRGCLWREPAGARRRVGGSVGSCRRHVGVRAGQPDRWAGQRDPRAQLGNHPGLVATRLPARVRSRTPNTACRRTVAHPREGTQPR